SSTLSSPPRLRRSQDLHSFPTRRSSDLGYPMHRSTPLRAQPVGDDIGSRSESENQPRRNSRTRRAALKTGGVLLLSVIAPGIARSEEHTSELQSRENLVCRLLLEKKKPN